MAEKLTQTFNDRAAAEKAKPTADEIGKKKLYCVTLPSPEAYAAHVKMHGTQAWMWTDGYASASYTVTRLMGGEVSVAPKDTAAAKAAIEAAKAEAAANAAALASTKQLLADLQAQMESMRAAQAAAEKAKAEGDGQSTKGRKAPTTHS